MAISVWSSRANRSQLGLYLDNGGVQGLLISEPATIPADTVREGIAQKRWHKVVLLTLSPVWTCQLWNPIWLFVKHKTLNPVSLEFEIKKKDFEYVSRIAAWLSYSLCEIAILKPALVHPAAALFLIHWIYLTFRKRTTAHSFKDDTFPQGIPGSSWGISRATLLGLTALSCVDMYRFNHSVVHCFSCHIIHLYHSSCHNDKFRVLSTTC